MTIIRKLNFLFLVAFAFSDASAIVIGERECAMVGLEEKENLSLDGLEHVDSYQVKRCESLEPGEYIYYLSEKPRLTVKGNCVYTEIQVNGASALSLIQKKGYFNMIAEGSGEACPGTLSPKYLRVVDVHSEHDKEEVYLALMRLLNTLRGSASGIDKALSSLPFFKRIFSSKDNEFKEQLLSQRSSEKGNGVNIEFIQKSEKGYMASFKVGKILWVLDLSLNGSVFNIDDISSATP